MTKKRVLMIVTGGIAAYKAADAVRRLMKQGAEVRVVMTESATKFVTPLTFQALSGHPVGVGMFEDDRPAEGMAHISFAQWPELVLVCPATANFLAKMAHGIADDLASSTILAARVPVIVCPAMNDGMWENPATQANLKILAGRGIACVGPDIGGLACRTMGKGRMSEPETIAEAVALFSGRDASRKKVIVTAGGTREPLDSVRVLTNISTGKLGALVVEHLARAGYLPVWVHGVQAATPSCDCVPVPVDSVADLGAALKKQLADPEVVGIVHGMAVSDFTVGGTLSLEEAGSLFREARNPSEVERKLIASKKMKAGFRKISSSEALLTVLLPGQKIIDSIRTWAKNPDLFLVSFKLTSGETEKNLTAIARKQLKKTRSDLVVANDSGALSDEGHVAWLITEKGRAGPFRGKEAIAAALVTRLSAALP